MACTTSCFHVRKWKNPGERKQGQTALFSMQLLLHIHCSVGVFKAAHVPTDTGWWARILAASSWRLKRKRHPVSEWLCMCTDKAMTPLRWCLGLGQGLAWLLSLSPRHLHLRVLEFPYIWLFLTARLISESHISGVHSLTTSFQVADIILLCLCLSQILFFPPVLPPPFIPNGGSWFYILHHSC